MRRAVLLRFDPAPASLRRRGGPLSCAVGAPLGRESKQLKGVPMASLSERFWSKVDVRGPDECWPWTGAVRKTYGQFALDGCSDRRTAAHRVMMMLGGVILPHGSEVHHRCGNRVCMNPAHLKVCRDSAAHRREHMPGCAHHGQVYMAILRSGDSAGRRYCTECRRVRTRQWRDRTRTAHGGTVQPT